MYYIVMNHLNILAVQVSGYVQYCKLALINVFLTEVGVIRKN